LYSFLGNVKVQSHALARLDLMLAAEEMDGIIIREEKTSLKSAMQVPITPIVFGYGYYPI